MEKWTDQELIVRRNVLLEAYQTWMETIGRKEEEKAGLVIELSLESEKYSLLTCKRPKKATNAENKSEILWLGDEYIGKEANIMMMNHAWIGLWTWYTLFVNIWKWSWNASENKIEAEERKIVFEEAIQWKDMISLGYGSFILMIGTSKESLRVYLFMWEKSETRKEQEKMFFSVENIFEKTVLWKRLNENTFLIYNGYGGKMTIITFNFEQWTFTKLDGLLEMNSISAKIEAIILIELAPDRIFLFTTDQYIHIWHWSTNSCLQSFMSPFVWHDKKLIASYSRHFNGPINSHYNDKNDVDETTSCFISILTENQLIKENSPEKYNYVLLFIYGNDIILVREESISQKSTTAFAMDRNFLFFGDHIGNLHIRDQTDSMQVCKINTSSHQPVLSIQLHPDQPYLFIRTADHLLHLYSYNIDSF